VGTLEQLGCWFDPSLPDGQAAKLLHHCHGDDVSNNGWPLSEASALIGRSISGHRRAVHTHTNTEPCYIKHQNVTVLVVH